jgi:hypothetical protein
VGTCRAEPNRGRFRTFLLTLLKRYGYDQEVRPGAQQKSEKQLKSLESLVKDEDWAYEPAGDETPEQALDRTWKEDILATVERNVQSYYETRPKTEDRRRYQISAAYCLGSGKSSTQEELAVKSHMSRDQVRYAIEDVQKRGQRFLRQEIHDQVGSEEDLEDKIRELSAGQG